MNRLAATYYVLYTDGSEEQFDIRYRQQINTGNPDWGEKCLQAVPQNSQLAYGQDSDNPWGKKQFRHYCQESNAPQQTYMNWICAWKNPHPEKNITGLRIEPGLGCIVLSAMTACDTDETPIRWLKREKALVRFPDETGIEAIDSDPDAESTRPFQSNYLFLSEDRARLLQIDMGAVISVVPRYLYDNEKWNESELTKLGTRGTRQFIVEYTAHPQAKLTTPGQEEISLADLKRAGAASSMTVIPPANQSIRLRVIDKTHRQPVAVRLHVHGNYDEYLTPVDRQRIPNSNIYEGSGAELTGPDMHTSTYISGDTEIKVPLGKVYVEVSKGFECTPVRKTVNITGETQDITIEVEKVLNWREKGWVTADTHVHFLSPKTASLEGAAEGVNVVNLLASQWGEFMTNVGDFDGKSTFVGKEAGDNYFVRVGTENRQNVMGHISLLGYNGNIITPLCAGGANEAAIGDPVDVLVTEWARRCRDQGGLVVVPHFPGPRAEHAATIVSGLVDAIEIDGARAAGYFEIECKRSSWICILIRGTSKDDGKEQILAHSSSVMVQVAGSQFFSAVDAVSILEQIEGSMAYIDHVGTRAETRRYKEMRLILEQVHKTLHDRLRQSGHDHSHDIGHNHH